MEDAKKKYCVVCSNEEEDDLHKTSPQHKINEVLHYFYQNRSSTRHPKHGVQLKVAVKRLNGLHYDFSEDPDKNGNHYLIITPEEFGTHGHQVDFSCSIINGRTRISDSIYILYAGVLHSFQPYSMIYPNGTSEQDKFVEVNAGDSYDVTVRLHLQQSYISNFMIPVCFYIQTKTDAGKLESFVVARSIVVNIQDSVTELERVVEKSPFTSNKWEKVRMIPVKHRFCRRSAGQYGIPMGYFKTLMYGLKKDFGDGTLHIIKQHLKPGEVTKENFINFFHTLLWLEETFAILGLSRYNMEDARLKYKAGVLQLNVPGLAEKRPSVIRGDLIELKIHGDHISYQGSIREVTDNSVLIEGVDEILVKAVKSDDNINIDVRFMLGRIHLERMHQGVEQVVATGFIDNLFPSVELLDVPVNESIVLTEGDFQNTNVFYNKEQYTAVQKIVNNTSKSVPYIVWGPPGTGKTVTIVEAINQLKRLTNYNILVCAPANAACNMLAEKLAKFCDTKELRRIMSENCDTSSVHESIIPYSNLIQHSDGWIEVMPFSNLKDLKKYRIIVTTLVFAGKFTRNYHPDIVFIDEAAQAREPEVCCAIGLLMKNKRLVLAGDPMQLGPVVNSDLCKKYKFDISLLERLMESELYQQDTQNNFTTMLKLNFRSHKEILRLPNKLFYKEQLEAVSASALSDPLAKTHIYKLIQSEGFSNQIGSPVEFCSVLATERREGRSPSYYNPKEVLMIRAYIDALTNIRFPDPAFNVSPAEIGIVTPYIRQVYKIREALSDYRDIEVGTTEAFQGREKRVMIISTVRAQENLLLHDKKYRVGFVKEPKRFNVAVTRAKSKLIVIGNPIVLLKDDKWGKLIEQARSLGTLCGAPFPMREFNELEEITNRLKAFL